jgi:putative transposase
MSKSISGKRRAAFWNYTENGVYFITICTFGRSCVFGKVEGSFVELTRHGEIVKSTILLLAKKYPHVKIDSFVVMPNHIHMVIGFSLNGQLGNVEKIEESKGVIVGRSSMSNPGIGQIIRYLKGKSTFEIRQFDKKFRWQANYYDHIIRDNDEMLRIISYIESNPSKWSADRFCR